MRAITFTPAIAFLAAWVVPATAIALSAGLALYTQPAAPRTITLQAHVAEQGGWTPGNITLQAGEKVRFELTAGDVTHGFAIGRMNMRPVRVMPGMTTQTEVTFNQPGKYTFYCTEWCSAAHWRMRGVIEVLGANSEASQADEVPDYARLSIDIDAPRSYVTTPAQRASAVRGAQWQLLVPASMLAREYYISHSPAQVWTTLRALPAFQNVSDQGIWDAVAWLWQRQTSPQAQTVGASLYARNCASCHGATGAGDGPMAGAMATSHMATRATNFTDGSSMLSASPALLEGKVIRGGMGTGMPYWGPIFTDAERRAVVDYLWQFQFDTSP